MYDNTEGKICASMILFLVSITWKYILFIEYLILCLKLQTFKGLTNNTMLKIHKERKCLRDERTKPICQKNLVGLFMLHACNETSSTFDYEQRSNFILPSKLDSMAWIFCSRF